MNDIEKPYLYLIELTEHERGWGQRLAGYIAVLSEAIADAYIKHKTAGRYGAAPDVYISYQKIGYHKCSDGVYHHVVTTSAESMHFNKLQELLN